MSGSKASHLHTVYTTHKSMNKKKTTLLVVDNVADVMVEAVSLCQCLTSRSERDNGYSQCDNRGKEGSNCAK